MPELPEVNECRLSLDAGLKGQTIQNVEILDGKIIRFCNPEEFRLLFKDFSIGNVSQHGKYIFIQGRQDLWMVMHLGMTGKVFFQDPGTDIPRFSRIAFYLNNGSILYYSSMRKLGFVAFTRDKDRFIADRKLGPHVLDISLEQFLERLARRKGPIKSILLNQSFVSGIGNLYADEALFQTGIHPRELCTDLSKSLQSSLYMNIIEIMRLSIQYHTDFSLLDPRYLLHDRKGRAACPRCGHPLQRIQAAGRTSVYCPTCQPLSPDYHK